MFLLSISSFGVESSWAPDVVCTFAPPKAWNVRPGTGNSSLVSPVAVSFVGNEDTLNKWNSEAIIKKVRGMISMAMGLPSSAYWPVRSFVALFIRKHGTLDEHCKHQSYDRDCWAYHNMLCTSNQLSLSARSPQCKTLSIFKGCRPCRRPRKNRQGSKLNWHKNSSVLRTLRLSTFFLCILLWNIFDRSDRFEFSFVNGFFIWVHVNIMILWFYGFMDLSNCIIVRCIYIYTIVLALLLYS